MVSILDLLELFRLQLTCNFDLSALRVENRLPPVHYRCIDMFRSVAHHIAVVSSW